jgi:hypothetical protein
MRTGANAGVNERRHKEKHLDAPTQHCSLQQQIVALPISSRRVVQDKLVVLVIFAHRQLAVAQDRQ